MTSEAYPSYEEFGEGLLREMSLEFRPSQGAGEDLDSLDKVELQGMLEMLLEGVEVDESNIQLSPDGFMKIAIPERESRMRVLEQILLLGYEARSYILGIPVSIKILPESGHDGPDSAGDREPRLPIPLAPSTSQAKNIN